jgi:hypothetical protein
LKYELRILEELVEYGLNPVNLSSITPEVLEEVLSCAQNEQIRVKRIFVYMFNSQVNESGIKQFVQRHQLGLINILDSLTLIIDNVNKELYFSSLLFYNELKGVQKTVYLIIEDLLSFIIYRYNRFCDLDLKITEKCRYLINIKFKKEIFEIEKNILLREQKLIIIGLTSLKREINNKRMPLTYRKILFYKELLRLIKRTLKIKDAEERENELIKAFLYVNFNSIYFVQYCVRRIKSELEARSQAVEKLEWLAWCLKVVKQSPNREGLILEGNNPSIKELLCQWIIEEISFWEIKLRLQIPKQKDINFSNESNIKIATDLSVPQLACFVRLLVVTQTIVNKRKEDVLEFYPEHFQSKRMESFEYGSFRSKYYGIQESTKESVKDLLIKMLNELRKL